MLTNRFTRRSWRRTAATTALGMMVAGASCVAAPAHAAPIPKRVLASRAWHPPRAQVGHAVSLNARAPLGAARGQKLAYRWTIVRRPRGSRARLSSASGAHPRLRPDVPGTYVLQATIGEIPSTLRGGSSAAGRVLCTRRCSTRRIRLSVAVAAGPLGVPVDTIATQNGTFGVQVGGTFYAAPDQNDALQLVVLDRSTLALVANLSFANTDQGALELEGAVHTVSSADLVIISKPNYALTNARPSDIGATTSIEFALGEIGVNPQAIGPMVATGTTRCASIGQCSAFSAIGIPGLPAGQGHINPGLSSLSGSGQQGGDLHGYLRQDLSSNANFAFVDDTRVAFDTGDPNADPAVVNVGSTEPGSPERQWTYTSSNLSGGAGFFVLVLDAGSLADEAQQTFTDDAAGISAMAALLNQWDSNPAALVIVRSIGHVGGTAVGPAWYAVANDLQAIGASKFYFTALNGTSSDMYAQVGPAGQAGYPSAWTQVASVERSGTGRLTGLLARNPGGQFYPAESYPTTLQDPSRPLAATLPGIVSLPATAWPDRSTTGDQNVLACIARHINPLGPLQTPIESNYTNLNDQDDWAAWATTITGANYYQTLSGYSDCAPFTQSDFEQVTGQLAKEWTAVPLVWSMIESLQAPLIDAQGNATQIASVVNTVNDDFTTTSPQTAQVDGLAFTSDVLWLVSSLPGLDDIAGPLNAIAAGFAMASDLNNSPSGANITEQTVTTTGANLGNTLEQQYSTDILGLSEVGDLLVSDWTKLQDAAQNASDTANAAADWSWNTRQATLASNQLVLAARRQAYRTLFPLAYPLWRVSAGTVPGSTDNGLKNYACWSYKFSPGNLPFDTTTPTYGEFPVDAATGNGVEQWLFATNNTDPLQVYPKNTNQVVYPTQPILNDLFASQDDAYQNGNPLFSSELGFAAEATSNGTVHVVTVTHYVPTDVDPNSDMQGCQYTVTP